MAIVTAEHKFLGVAGSVNTKQTGSASVNANTKHWTIEDIVATAKADGDLGVTGDMAVSGNLTVTGTGSAADMTVSTIALSALGTAPVQGDTGVAGEIRVVADGIYVCTAANTWASAALTAL